jgi:Carboxypeptidase regulatory-like domain
LAAEQQTPVTDVRTGTDGIASINDLRHGAYLLAVSARGYSSRWHEVVLSNGAVTEIEIRLQPRPGSLTGKVTSVESGAPLAGATIVLGTWSTRTDASGGYSLTGLTPGAHTLQVSVEGYQLHEASVTIRPGAYEALDVSLTPRLGTLLVRVVDAATGDPIDSATVSSRVGEGLPCADPRLLVPLKRSRLYGVIRPRVAELRPVDSWLQDELHFFVFRLHPEDGAELPEPPLAVFAMHPASKDPLSGVVVTPSPNGEAAEVLELQEPGT